MHTLANGDIHAEHPHGVFHEDTRILSPWSLAVNVGPVGYGDSPLIGERLRELGAGVLEEFTIWNYSSHAAECVVALGVESDFADLFEVKRH